MSGKYLYQGNLPPVIQKADARPFHRTQQSLDRPGVPAELARVALYQPFIIPLRLNRIRLEIHDLPAGRYLRWAVDHIQVSRLQCPIRAKQVVRYLMLPHSRLVQFSPQRMSLESSQ